MGDFSCGSMGTMDDYADGPVYGEKSKAVQLANPCSNCELSFLITLAGLTGTIRGMGRSRRHHRVGAVLRHYFYCLWPVPLGALWLCLAHCVHLCSHALCVRILEEI